MIVSTETELQAMPWQIRDEFASRACIGILAAWDKPDCEFDPSAVAARAYTLADANSGRRYDCSTFLPTKDRPMSEMKIRELAGEIQEGVGTGNWGRAAIADAIQTAMNAYAQEACKPLVEELRIQRLFLTGDAKGIQRTSEAVRRIDNVLEAHHREHGMERE